MRLLRPAAKLYTVDRPAWPQHFLFQALYHNEWRVETTADFLVWKRLGKDKGENATGRKEMKQTISVFRHLGTVEVWWPRRELETRKRRRRGINHLNLFLVEKLTYRLEEVISIDHAKKNPPAKMCTDLPIVRLRRKRLTLNKLSYSYSVSIQFELLQCRTSISVISEI